ncbi:protease complex subunit PrcB family protein [Mesoterricola silvestris]|uniref:PrcB C-terminal domain-containing protein n=1 Tax=Mesoterricola silvestris TaxID=2927979 RepID=A0AA48KBT7_9BACT|nr:protease complex subunit PrcB family protein [Mesoterricola silvestris]BDU74662.1 hypothetical protein METEAL_38360 [Mesoterricola silvestris]
MRSPFFIGRALALAVPALALAAAPSTPREAQAARIWRDSFGGKPTPGAEVLGDASAWNAFWRSQNRDTPAFDFTGAVAVVAYGGEKATGGYAVDFLEPTPQGNDLVVTWQVVPPPADAMVPQVLTRPWAVRAFPRPTGGVIVKQVNAD